MTTTEYIAPTGGTVCCGCDHTKNTGARLPRGWKRQGDGTYCDKCWHARYTLRAITIPAVRPLGDGIGWPELRTSLTEAWSEVTACANWMASELYSRDTKRMPTDAKITTMPKIYLYPDAVARFPTLPTQVVASLENTMKSKWSARRYEVLWTCEASTPNARYPQPFPVPGQAWKATYDTAGKDGGDPVPCVTVTLLRGQRFTLQLRGGQEFRRQLRDFRAIADGSAIQGELQLIRQKVTESSHRATAGTGRDSGGQKFQTRLMVKLVAWFPRVARSEATDTLFLRTDGDAFLVAIDCKQNKIRTWNADHVRRWISEHTRRLNRWSDDQKAEQRPVASFQSRRESAVDKFANRIKSFTNETVAQITGVARRMKFAEVRLDDSDRRYFGVSRFEWSAFRARLATKLNEHGITFTLASGDVEAKSSESRATTEGEAP